MKITRWNEYKSGTLQGFLDVELVSGMGVRDLTLHQKDGKSWIAYPSKPYQKDGETKYSNYIFFEDTNRHNKFQEQALAAERDHYRRLAAQGVTRKDFDSFEEFAAWIEGRAN